jgi:hypothetical protein
LLVTEGGAHRRIRTGAHALGRAQTYAYRVRWEPFIEEEVLHLAVSLQPSHIGSTEPELLINPLFPEVARLADVRIR